MKRTSPEKLIEALRKSDEYIKSIYLNGGCWQFYKFLKLLYPKAKPYKVSISGADIDHIVTKIGNKYYDITGEVYKKDFYLCSPVKSIDIETFEKWNFAKKNILYKECPYCGEQIFFDTKGNIGGNN